MRTSKTISNQNTLYNKILQEGADQFMKEIKIKIIKIRNYNFKIKIIQKMIKQTQIMNYNNNN